MKTSLSWGAKRNYNVKYIWNNSYLNCGCRWKWGMIIAVNFPIWIISYILHIISLLTRDMNWINWIHGAQKEYWSFVREPRHLDHKSLSLENTFFQSLAISYLEPCFVTLKSWRGLTVIVTEKFRFLEEWNITWLFPLHSLVIALQSSLKYEPVPKPVPKALLIF